MVSIKNMIAAAGYPGLGILLLAFVLRVLLLDLKPPHFDEGVNGLFVDQIQSRGYYHYDPANYHGPLHMYVLFVSQALFGRHLWALRMPVVIVSTAAVGLMLGMERFIGRAAARWAALALAVSPAAVFYGRYAIHETWLLFFLLLTTYGIAGLWRRGDRRSLWMCGLGVTGMILTKETYFIHAGCMLLAAGTLLVLEKGSPSEGWPWAPRRWTGRDLLEVIGVSVFLIVFFYSGTFLDLPGLKGLFQTFAAWGETGREGHGHDKPAWYWLQLLAIYEAPALLGLAASAWLVWPGSDRFLRFIAIYGTGALAAYSIVPYKTPWCVLVLVWPFFMVFGGVVERMRRWRGIASAAAGAALAAGLFQCVRLNFFHYTDEREKYVYVQTFRDIEKLTGPLFELVRENPANYHLRGHVILEHYHPLPWVLGDFPNVGFQTPEHMPLEMDAAFVIVDSSSAAEVERALKDKYYRQRLHLRASQGESTLYLSYDVFRKWFNDRPPDFVPGKDEER